MSIFSWPRTHFRACAGLALACALLFLPGFFTLQPMDRDEPRFAQATKQMLETGDYVAIRFQDEARNKKPVGIYWLQAASVALGEAAGVEAARGQIWLYRLPSLAGAILAVLLTYWAALPLLERRGAFIAALLFASTLLLTVEARLAKTDAVVAATVVVAMGALARVWMRRAGPPPRWGVAAAFWTALAIGILVKGPITPMIPLFAAIALSLHARSARWLLALRPAAGALWCAVLVAPWLILIGLKTHGAFFSDSIGGDMLGKVAAGQELHGAPPLTYLAVFWLTAWPMAPFAALAAPFTWRNWRDARVFFAIAWLLPAWILFELVPTKLPHYVLPLYPAITILIALAWAAGALNLTGRWRKGVALLLPIVLVLVPMAAVALSVIFGGAPPLLFYPLAVLVFIVAAAAAWLIRRGRVEGLLVLAPALAGVAILFAFEAVLTATPFAPFAVSPGLAAARDEIMRAEPGCADWPTATLAYREPSLVFLTRTDLVMTDSAGAAAFLAAAPCRIAFVDASREVAFRAALPPGLAVRLHSRVAGQNLNRSGRLDIGVYVRHGGPHE